MANRKGERSKKGVYEIDGFQYPSVTTVIRDILRKEGLEIWMAGTMYDALKYKRYLTKRQAIDILFKPSSIEMEIGTAVHSIVEHHENTEEYLKLIPDDFLGYMEAYRAFVKEYGFEDISKEQTLASKKYGFAGTYDRFGRLKSGKNALIDIKTGKDLYPEVYLQLSAYKQLIIENNNVEVDEIGGLLLRANGTFKYEPGEDILPVFLGLKTAWDWRNK